MKSFFCALALFSAQISFAKDNPSVETLPQAPLFELKNQDNQTFNLKDRAGKGWTVLFFYPKAGTPGCTTQVCSFRDSIKLIKQQGAEVYGISTDSVAVQKKFHTDHHLVFDLLSDESGKVVDQYGGRRAVLNVAKRDTYVLDDKLRIRKHLADVDPALDAQNVANLIKELKAQAPTARK